jgi:hypothetical protein
MVFGAIVLLLVGASAAAYADDSLVTPVRVGNPDAPLTLTVWAQQDYSHLAALAPIADAFHLVFADWERARRRQARGVDDAGARTAQSEAAARRRCRAPAGRRVDR